MSWTSSPREAKSVATRMRTRPANHKSCDWDAIVQPVPAGPHFVQAGHVLSLKSWKASSRSRCSWPPCRHCTAIPCRLMSLDRSSALAFPASGYTKRAANKVRQSTSNAKVLRLWCCRSRGESDSHYLLSDKDEDFVLRQHVPDEVQQVGLLLLLADDQHRLLHRVHSLWQREANITWEREGRVPARQQLQSSVSIFATFLKAERLFVVYFVGMFWNELINSLHCVISGQVSRYSINTGGKTKG